MRVFITGWQKKTNLGKVPLLLFLRYFIGAEEAKKAVDTVLKGQSFEFDVEDGIGEAVAAGICKMGVEAKVV